jgi:hypothetical protein
MTDTTQIITVADDQSILKEADKIVYEVWPEFMLHDAVLDRLWSHLRTDFPQFQFGLQRDGAETLEAFANCIPLRWEESFDKLPDRGIDEAMEIAIDDFTAGREPNILCALQILVPLRNRGQRLSSRMVQLMIEIGRQRKLTALIALVRPNLQHRYPLTPIEKYVAWQTGESLPFDPWLRVHARLGGEIVKVCPQSMDIRGSVETWEKWTEMRFPESGSYIVPGALVPVSIDCEHDEGVYIEPNVWTLHWL